MNKIRQILEIQHSLICENTGAQPYLSVSFQPLGSAEPAIAIFIAPSEDDINKIRSWVTSNQTTSPCNSNNIISFDNLMNSLKTRITQKNIIPVSFKDWLDSNSYLDNYIIMDAYYFSTQDTSLVFSAILLSDNKETLHLAEKQLFQSEQNQSYPPLENVTFLCN